MTNKMLINLINDMLIQANYDHHRYDFKDEKIAGLANNILSQMHDAWAVFDPDGDITEGFSNDCAAHAVMAFLASDEGESFGDLISWEGLQRKGYTVKPIKWMVCDE